MPRQPREEAAGGVYHVYARGNRREAIFVDDEDRRDYLSTFGQVAREMRWRPLAFCLMTNHVHHLIELTEPNLGEGMRRAHGAYARMFNERHQTGGGHLFERRFGSTRATSDGVAMYFACYVLLNPVRAGLCDTPEDFRWSSCGRPTAWVDEARLLSYFGSAERFRHILSAVTIMGAAGFIPATSRLLGGDTGPQPAAASK